MRGSEFAELKARFAGHVPSMAAEDEGPPPLVAGTVGAAVAAQTGVRVTPPGVTADQFAELSVDVAELRAEIARLKDRLQSLETKLDAVLS